MGGDIVGFISRSEQEIIGLFWEVLKIGREMGLIGREMFAVLPGNASQEWSGTKEVG